MNAAVYPGIPSCPDSEYLPHNSNNCFVLFLKRMRMNQLRQIVKCRQKSEYVLSD